MIKDRQWYGQCNKYTRYQCLQSKKSRILQPMGSTIYWLQIWWWSRKSHNRINTQYYSRRRRRRFYQWADQYDQWDNTSYTPVEEDETGAPTLLMLTIVFSTSQRPNGMGNQRQELSVKCLNQVTSRIIISARINHKYRTFEANYQTVW